MPTFNRRTVLKALGLSAGVSAIGTSAEASTVKEITFSPNPLYTPIAQPITAIAVSYTHLDVYKRQAQHRQEGHSVSSAICACEAVRTAGILVVIPRPCLGRRVREK